MRRDNALKHQKVITYDDLAALYAAPTPTNTFRDWLSAGKRLLLLCAAGT